MSRRDVERQVTFLVKTFERPAMIRRLLASARRFYPEATILVADDSRRPAGALDATLFRLPFDSGLAHGRNVLIDRVETPYFLLLDDDYVFDRPGGVERLLGDLLEGGLDIAAGEWFRWGRPSRFFGLLERRQDTLLALPGSRGEIAGCALYDFVPNFYVGRTGSARRVRWDKELKVGEHLDFFWRAKHHGLRVALDPRVTIVHAPVEPRFYRPYRLRGEIEDRVTLMSKHGLKRIDNQVTDRSWSLLSDGSLYLEPASLRGRERSPPPWVARAWRTATGFLPAIRRAPRAGDQGRPGVSLRHLVTAGSRALPDFLIVGAQDAGGEAAWDHLVASGLVSPPRVSGIAYFDRHHWRGRRWYRAHFPRAPRLEGGVRRPTGEASCGYLFHPAAPARAAALLPAVKLVVVVCDPVVRARRQFRRQRRLGAEPFGELRQALLAETQRVFAAWQRALWYPLDPGPELRRFSYVWGGHYADQLRRWLDHFPREQVLVLQAERLAADPAAELGRLHDFLGLAPPAPGARLALPAEESTTDPELDEVLRRHFAPRDAALEELLAEPLAWRDAG